MTEIKIYFAAAQIYVVLPKRWEGCYFSITELLSNITDHSFYK